MSTAKLLNLDQVAERLSMSKAWVRDHATRRNPRIKVVWITEEGENHRGVMRFRPCDIDAFIDRHLSSI